MRLRHLPDVERPQMTPRNLLVAGALLVAGCRSERVTCYTCIEACAPFTVAVCEPYPAARLSDPITCGCNPLVRVDVPGPTIGPAKARRP
jgi:hypothetical protein